MATRERLVAALLAAWCEQASGELSARTIAARAGANASAIYYHFDDMERLYVATQEEAIERARRWCRARTDDLAALGPDAPMPAEAFAPLLAALIDDLCEAERPIAFAWHECSLLAARNPRFAPVARRWSQLWRDFFVALSEPFGLRVHAGLIALFFDGESMLHLMRWGRIADRACLGESCRGWAAWLDGRIGLPAPWRARMRGLALRETPEPPPGGPARDIASAAAALIAQGGVAAVTHRAVAAATGLTLGMVSHQYRRTDDLLGSAFAEIYRRFTGAGPAGLPPSHSLPEATEGGEAGSALAIDELILAVARGGATSALALRLRYLRGATSRRVVIDRCGSAAGDGLFEGALYSSYMMAVGRLVRDRPDARAARTDLQDRLLALCRPHHVVDSG